MYEAFISDCCHHCAYLYHYYSLQGQRLDTLPPCPVEHPEHAELYSHRSNITDVAVSRLLHRESSVGLLITSNPKVELKSPCLICFMSSHVWLCSDAAHGCIQAE